MSDDPRDYAVPENVTTLHAWAERFAVILALIHLLTLFTWIMIDAASPISTYRAPLVLLAGILPSAVALLMLQWEIDEGSPASPLPRALWNRALGYGGCILGHVVLFTTWILEHGAIKLIRWAM